MPPDPPWKPGMADCGMHLTLRTSIRRLGLAAALLALVAAALLAAALQSTPAVAVSADPDHEDVARAIALIHAQDPRRAPPGVVHTLSLSDRDLELLLNHAAQRWLGTHSQVSIERGAALVRSSVRAPANPFGRWLNVQATLQQTAGLPTVTSVRIGSLALPGWLGQRIGGWMLQRLGLMDEFRQLSATVRQVAFQPQQLQLSYVWPGGGGPRRLLSALLPPDEQARLHVYSDKLAALSAELASRSTTGWSVPLPDLMRPMFELARQRSAGGDAAAENRAALLVMTLHAVGHTVATVLPAAAAWTPPRPLLPTLAGGRLDLAQHLLVSALLAAEGTSPLSRAVGVYKEVADSRGGSGFSFDDLAADRAGTRLGQLAVQAPRRLQALLSAQGGLQEADFMPSVDGLPSQMPEPEFRRRFGGVGEAPYVAMVAEIDRRLDALPAWRDAEPTTLR